jgi:hypothetical protein
VKFYFKLHIKQRSATRGTPDMRLRPACVFLSSASGRRGQVLLARIIKISLDGFVENKNLLQPTEIKPRILGRPAHSPVTVPAFAYNRFYVLHELVEENLQIMYSYNLPFFDSMPVLSPVIDVFKYLGLKYSSVRYPRTDILH